MAGKDAPRRMVPVTFTPGSLNFANSSGRNLILAPIGANSVHFISWLDDADSRTFDILPIYYTPQPPHPCPACIGAYHGQGPKFQLLHQVLRSQQWQAIHPRYDVVMLADDDIIMSTHTLNEAFRIFGTFNMTLAQPTLCRHPQVGVSHGVVLQNQSNLIRYTPFVEIMMPIMTMDVLNSVVGPTFEDAYTGWGLDFVWPFLLKYPRRGIGLIDAICAIHPKSQAGKVSSYGFTHPKAGDARGEFKYMIMKYGLTDDAVESYGVDTYPQDITWEFVTAEVARRPAVALQQQLEEEPSSPELSPLARVSAGTGSDWRATAFLLTGLLAGVAMLWRRLARHRPPNPRILQPFMSVEGVKP